MCYHSVSDAWPHALAVRRRSFARQISVLKRRGLRPIAADKLFDGVRRGVHLTFDDAFRDILDVVPILEEAGFAATVFAVTSLADEGGTFDVPELATDAVEHRQRLATMRWSELQDLAERGFEIGSHTVTHPHLTRLGDAELESELRDSRACIEDELKRPCRLLAYPYGEHDGRVQEAAGRAGYEAAFGLWAGTDPANRYALPRIDFYRGDSLPKVFLKTTFVKPHASALLARVRDRS